MRRRIRALAPDARRWLGRLAVLGGQLSAGLVHEVNYWHDRSRFDANLELHHHLICLGCRKIEYVTDVGLDRLKIPPQRRAAFEVTGHRVEFHGYCAACRKARRRSTRGKNSFIQRQQRRRQWERA